MAEIVVAGGGMCGLLTGVLLADGGNDVTVLERDASAPPGDPEAAWQRWERRGVNQFRLLHYLQPRFRALMDEHLPRLASELKRFGAQPFNPVHEARPDARGELRPDDERFTTITGRRPVVEAALAAVAAATPRLTIRRGAGVAGVVTGTPARDGVPHVAGLRTDGGEEIRADLVVDACGRRSALPQWLAAIGTAPAVEEEEDSGFVYFGRHFRAPAGARPPLHGPLLAAYGTISTLILPADNGTWGVGVIASGADTALRALKDPERWTAVVRSIPAAAPLIDAEPIDERIQVIARIPDRYRSLVRDGEPTVTGIVPVADAWACTNPSVGRGITIGFIHALALRDTVAGGALDDPWDFALAFHDATARTAEPWFRATLALDRSRLAEISALLEGREYGADDPQHGIVRAMGTASLLDPEVLRGFSEIGGMLSTPDEVFAREGFFDRVLEYAGQDPPLTGPTREQLLALVA